MPGSETTAVIPRTKSVIHEFKFRIKATSEGLSIGFSDDISVTLIGCDAEGPVLQDEVIPFEIKQVRDFRSPFTTVDVSSFFRPFNHKCPINGFKVIKVANKITKAVEDVDYVSIDKKGLLKV